MFKWIVGFEYSALDLASLVRTWFWRTVAAVPRRRSCDGLVAPRNRFVWQRQRVLCRLPPFVLHFTLLIKVPSAAQRRVINFGMKWRGIKSRARIGWDRIGSARWLVPKSRVPTPRSRVPTLLSQLLPSCSIHNLREFRPYSDKSFARNRIPNNVPIRRKRERVRQNVCYRMLPWCQGKHTQYGSGFRTWTTVIWWNDSSETRIQKSACFMALILKICFHGNILIQNF